MKRCLLASLLALIVLLPSIANAQNPNILEQHNDLYNCHFTGNNPVNSYGGLHTQYTWVDGGVWHGLQGNEGAGKLTIGSTAINYNSNFYDVHGHGGSSDRFLIVNGYGGTGTTVTPGQPSSNYIIRYTVTGLEPNVLYNFSFWGVHLSKPTQPGYNFGVRFRVQCNGTDVTYGNNQNNWQPDTNNPSEWKASPTFPCWSDGSGGMTITIYDDCRYSSGNGDDFGIDDVSLSMSPDYSVTAKPVNGGSHCVCESADGVFVILIPNSASQGYQCTFQGQNYNPTFSLKDSDGVYKPATQAQPVTTTHGIAWLDNNHQIHYLPNEGYFGDETISYKVERWGLSAQSTIAFSVRDLPEFNGMSANTWPADGRLCLESVVNFNPSANWIDHGASVFYQGWMWSSSNTPNNWQESASFANVGIGDYNIRFEARNSCNDNLTCSGDLPTYSELMVIHVCNTPVINNDNSLPNSICAGSELPAVNVNWNNNEHNGSWYYKHNGGSYVPLDNLNDLNDGDYIRYQIVSPCGNVNSKEILVTSGPSFTAQVANPFDSEYCPNTSIPQPQIPSNWYNTNGLSGVTVGWYWVSYDESGNAIYTPINGSTIALGTESRLVTCGLQSDCGLTPFDPAFELQVFVAPSIEGLDLLPEALERVCANTSLSDLLPALTPVGHHGQYGWEISAEDTPTSFSTNLPVTLSSSDNGRWIRFYVEPLCDGHERVTTNPLQLVVGDVPTLNVTQIQIFAGFCNQTEVSELVDQGKLTAVEVTSWNLFDDPEDPEDPSYEQWEVLVGGQWVPFTVISTDYDGCVIRYHAHNHCGDSYAELTDGDALSVTSGPEFVNMNLYDQLSPYYCVSDGGLDLQPITDVDYDAHGLFGTRPYWAWSETEDGNFEEIPNNHLPLTEDRNGFLRCYLFSDDCGGSVAYPTAFPLTIVAQPEISSFTIDKNELCEGELFEDDDLEVSLELHHGTEISREWYYAMADDLNDTHAFNPFFDPLPTGTVRILCVVENECSSASAWSSNITVLEAPHIVLDDDWTGQLSVCVGEHLANYLPSLEVTGYVEDVPHWECYTPSGDPANLPNVLTIAHDGLILRYIVKGCGYSVAQEDVVLHVIDVPDIALVSIGSLPSLLCEGATLDVYTPSDLVFEWKRNNEMFNVGPDGDPFAAGAYMIQYRVANDCGWSEFSAPVLITVAAGPSYTMPESWQQALEVCEDEPIDSSSIPSVASFINNQSPEDDLLGWFLRSPDLLETIPWNFETPVSAMYDGYSLIYGLKTSCQDMPLFSPGKPILVLGAPEITGDVMDVNTQFCDGEQPDIDALEVSVHPNDRVKQYWEICVPGSSEWVQLPSVWNRAEHDGASIRYTVASLKCSAEPAVSEMLEIQVNAEPVVDIIPESISVCAQGYMSVLPDVEWNQLTPGVGYWQVSANGNGGWDTSLDGHEFDAGQVDDYFHEKYVRYVVEGSCGSDESNAAQLSLLASAEVEIQGQETVSVMNSYWPGVYFYYTDVESPLNWTLEPEIWEVTDTIINGKSCCMIVVRTMGTALLSAKVGDGSCGMDVIRLNAVQFGIGEEEPIPVSIYPNPAQHTVVVESESMEYVRVYNVLGQQVKFIEAQGDARLSFNVDNLSEALYIIEIKTPMGMVRKTLTVAR